MVLYHHCPCGHTPRGTVYHMASRPPDEYQSCGGVEGEVREDTTIFICFAAVLRGWSCICEILFVTLERFLRLHKTNHNINL